MGWCQGCGTRRTTEPLCIVCASKGVKLPEPAEGPFPLSAEPPTALRPADDRGHPLRRAGRGLRTPLLVIAAIVGFNLAFPILVANQRPTVLTQSGIISAAAAPRLAAPSAVPPWDPVDVDLYVNACTQSEPASVCRCQAQQLQPLYSGEQALAYANQQASDGSRAILPTGYKDTQVRCSEGY